MADTFAVPFPLPSTGPALNSQVRINLDALVTAINDVSNGNTHFNLLSLGTSNVFNGAINWYSASNTNVVNLAMGNNKNLIMDGAAFNLLSNGVTVGGNNEVEVLIQNTSTGTNLGSRLFLRAASTGQGDAYVSMIVANTTSWSIGIDNDASDAFKISKSGSLGSNDYFVISTAGVVTMSVAPIFSALTASTVPYLDSSKALTSSSVTPTELGYLSGVSSAIQTQLGLKAPLASPTFTGTVTIPTPFTLGAVSVTATGTELNYVVGVTSAIQTQLGLKAPLASPTFTGTVTAPTVSITNTSSHLTLSTSSNTAVVQANAQATSSRTFSIPDISGNGTFAFLEGTQTFSGSKTFSSPILAVAGTASAPGVAFSAETNSGMYRQTTNALAFAINGGRVFNFTTGAVGFDASIVANADNTYTCGASGARWSAVWAANGTIQTSMAVTKTNITEMKPEECSIPRAIYYTRPGEEITCLQLGFEADNLPPEAHPVVDPITGERAVNDVYVSAVIAMLCLAARNDYKRIKALETKVAQLLKQ